MDRSDSRRRALFMAAILAMFAVACATAPGAAAGPALKADYRFEVSYASSVAGAPHLESTPTGTSNVFQSVNMGNRKVPVMLFPADTGVDLPGMDNVIPRDSYTIVVLMRFDDISGYRRIIDFANLQSDDGLYSDDGDLAMYDQVEAANPTIAAGHWAQVVLTRSSAGRLKGFVDGVRQFSFDDSSTRLGVVTAGRNPPRHRDHPSRGEPQRPIEDAASDDQLTARRPCETRQAARVAPRHPLGSRTRPG